MKVIIQMMADFMQQRAQKGAKGNHLFALGGFHPQCDLGSFAFFPFVKTMQLTFGRAGSFGQDFGFDWVDIELLADLCCECVGDA